jgi:hypothetical protein
MDALTYDAETQTRIDRLAHSNRDVDWTMLEAILPTRVFVGLHSLKSFRHSMS